MFTLERSIVWENRIFTTSKTINYPLLTYTRNQTISLHHLPTLWQVYNSIAWRHKFTYQVIRSLVSIRHFIFEDGDVNYIYIYVFKIRIWLYWSYHYHCCDILSLMYIFFDCIENNLFLYCSHLNMHTCISIYIRTTYKLPTIEHTCVLLWESNLFFFLRAICLESHREREKKTRERMGELHL